MPDGDVIQATVTPGGREGEPVAILLPSGPITTEVVGISGVVYTQVLVDDPVLGSPTHRIEPIAASDEHPDM